MPLIVPRRAKSSPRDASEQTRWLADWRDASAYVLLGDPGSGKTECMKAERAAVGGRWIPATWIQEGLAPEVQSDDILFIDAVDEVRGGSHAGDVLGAVGRYLRANGSPRFRLACREADWHGEADRQLIASVVPKGDLEVLHLLPLSDDDIRDVLQASADRVPDALSFVQEARRQGVYELLRNPLLLDLMVDAVAAGGRWPETRAAVYEAACQRLAEERSDAHRRRSALQPGLIETILADAGSLCAILLLSGCSAIGRAGSAGTQVADLNALPTELGLHDPERVIRSKVFTVEGDLAQPRHRTLAEYLAARAIARRIDAGLPLSRVLALVQGHDGVPVEAMRGLCAWLAVHLQGTRREQLLRLDPVGFIVNGDAAALTHAQRLLMLEALSASAAQNRWFRSAAWIEHPFGPLATPDMAEVYAQKLSDPDRSSSHQAFVDCLLDALKHAPQAMPEPCPALARWVEDGQAFDVLRVTAYEAWLGHCPVEQRGAQLRAWLHALENGTIDDPDDRLLGRVLCDAYPQVIQTEVLRFFRPKKTSRVIGEFSQFWSDAFIRKTPPPLLPALAEAWLAKFPAGSSDALWLESTRTSNALLTALLESHGDSARAEALYRWLGIGLDESGLAERRGEADTPITLWLQARPGTMKAIAAVGYLHAEPDPHVYWGFWRAEARLHHAAKPRDWIRWNMALASDADDGDFVQWVVGRAAAAAIEPPQGLDAPTMDEVCDWVDTLPPRFAQAQQWLQEAWTVPLEDWRTKQRQRQARHLAERDHERELRRKQYAPLLAAWPAQPIPAQMLHHMALAHEDLYHGIQGQTPEHRIADLLGAEPAEVEKALQAIDDTLNRDDLPTVEAILELEARQKEHFLRAPALLAARRACAASEQAWRAWTPELQRRLVAFWLTWGADEEPTWFKALAAELPDLVAPILVRYANGNLRRKGPQAITGLRSLTHDHDRRILARRVLPELLEAFPLRAHEAARGELNRSLLPGLHLLPREQALNIVHRRLALSSLDRGQRMAWLVALLPYEPEAVTRLVQEVGRQPRRVEMLGQALSAQALLGQPISPMPARCVQQLIELLAPLTPHDPDRSGGWVTDARRREDMVRALLANLGRNPTPDAAAALADLLSGNSLGNWRTEAEYQQQAQRRLLREASFTAARPVEVARVLCQGRPAHIADLQALVVDHLRCIESELRGDPAFQLRRFWQDDGRPRDEEDCRDILLALLRPLLERQQVDLQAESRAAAAKRMDLRASAISPAGRRFSLPIEAKKDNHREVWTAWRTQLQALYTIDPSAAGRGLYLVFWFGVDSRPSPEGRRPHSAADLETRINARLRESDRPQLAVTVMDLSWPATARRAA